MLKAQPESFVSIFTQNPAWTCASCQVGWAQPLQNKIDQLERAPYVHINILKRPYVSLSSVEEKAIRQLFDFTVCKHCVLS